MLKQKNGNFSPESTLVFILSTVYLSFPGSAATYGTAAGDQNNGCDCYILGTLVTKSSTSEAQTVLKKKKPQIVWEEALLFPVKEEELPEAMLTLTLRNCDKFSRHSIVGEIKPSLANVGEPYGTVQCEKMKTFDKVSYEFHKLLFKQIVFSGRE